ncbi:Pre-mRNA-splicing factor SPF27 [Geodia barretti]|uniref:Pre-mRNA-splicing factor SPF27 n=1 Tax=Geodia barretti TaxID=519541 RepID=A0AA35RCT7_GEOBA|nr:Pre-mRNA-splicing factor SPF27 [Geodia barretti]
MASEVQLDALPYVDQGYDEPGVREAAMQLVDEETRRYRPTKNYLDFLQPPKSTFETDILRSEFERLAARQPMELLSMKRYELPQPAAAQRNDLSAWVESVENSMAQLEHQSGRIVNLELLLKYSSNEWRMNNMTLTHMVGREQHYLKTIRQEVQGINWQRKTEQVAAGTQLSTLTDHWNSLVRKNYELEQACTDLEKEAVELGLKQGGRLQPTS